mmetsp:Transcript_37947/g.90762  ORF Transcript_37947/g.90762 Transcript_37947/m.90762 type:complete len:218 (+) Transcript_37947:2-655(+)
MGDSSKASTQRGNLLAVRWVLGVVVALVRRCQWGCEQPSSSLLPYIGAVRFLMQINIFGLGFPPAHIVRFWMGHYGSSTMKRTMLFGNMTWLHQLAEAQTLDPAKRASWNSTGVVTRKRRADGTVAVTGGPRLTSTESYPARFCRRIMHFHRCMSVDIGYVPSLPSAEDFELAPVPVDASIWSPADLEPLVQFLKSEIENGSWKPRWPLPLSSQPAE